MLAQVRRCVIVVLIACTSACATAQPVVRLTPREPVYKWQQGRAVLVKERNGLEVALAYDRNYEDLLGFRLEIVNKSEHEVVFEPARSYGAFCAPGHPVTAEVHCRGSSWFVDPEARAATLEVQEASAAADHANEQSWNTGLLFLNLAAGDSSGTLHTVGRMDTEDARRASSEARFGSALEFWQAATFRKTTLQSGEASAGLVMVKRDAGAPIVRVRIHVGPEAFDFEFGQQILNPTASQFRASRQRL